MKNGFYSRIAVNNLKKNRRFYIPRILTETGLLACFYIVLTLAMDPSMRGLRGGSYLVTFMWIGTLMVTGLSLILTLYTNSFLMKQRTKEFGLYNILGMEKRHVRKVLFWESFCSSIISLILGMGLGIVFYKFCALLICRLLQESVVFGFGFIRPLTIFPSLLIFLGMDVFTYILNCIRIGRMKPVELLQNSHVGEREPKVRRLLLLLGTVALAGGYYQSLTTTSALQAVNRFFPAVFLVIIGTYFLFIAGSVWVLKLLKKNEKYYYTPKHMPVVSGLLYRMKQNAVGLASITILATMVLVMISTTFSLYSGMETMLDQNYPQELYVSSTYTSSVTGESVPLTDGELKPALEKAAGEAGLTIESMISRRYLEASYLYTDQAVSCDHTRTDTEHLATMLMITAETYRELTGEKLALAEDEIAICPLSIRSSKYNAEDTVLTIGGGTRRIVRRLESFPLRWDDLLGVMGYGIILANDDVLQAVYEEQLEGNGDAASEIQCQIAVKFSDREAACERGELMWENLSQCIDEVLQDHDDYNGARGTVSDSLWDTKSYIYGMYGSLLFLGLLLGIVFLFATALIIYYKQISEGYEDRQRFQIMEKIGMSSSEVRKTIREQIILVFFLPLAAAAVHTVMAFPILIWMLRVLMLPNTGIFFLCAAITFVLFAVIYLIIYALTARTYYKIVH